MCIRDSTYNVLPLKQAKYVGLLTLKTTEIYGTLETYTEHVWCNIETCLLARGLDSTLLKTEHIHISITDYFQL